MKLQDEITEAYEAVDYCVKVANDLAVLRELEAARNHLFQARVLTGEKDANGRARA